MAENFQQYYFETRLEWREWLTENHDKCPGIFFVYYKKHTKKPTVYYNDAVEEALCFGWIDSIVKRIDDERYMQKFTPRNEKSHWSELNKQRVERMLREGKMTDAGMIKIRKAKENGNWDDQTDAQKDFKFSKEIGALLDANAAAKDLFYQLPPSHKKNYIQWIMSAKKQETQIRRTMKMIELLLNGKSMF
jgi:uncharacterized protein YdeI (YjbR/CyaY-like superfamily)